MTRLMTIKEVADHLRCTKRHVREMPIPRVRLGKRSYRYDPRDLIKLGYFPSPPAHAGWVYFVAYRNMVKIGKAKNWKSRVSNLQVGSPVKLTVIGLMEGDAAKERELHRLFEGRRMWGEWFLMNDEIRSYIKSNCHVPAR
jgi:hypothetical protein